MHTTPSIFNYRLLRQPGMVLLLVALPLLIIMLFFAPRAGAQVSIVGCPDGPAGEAAPGTVCPGGIVPNPDPSLPWGCPGSASQDPTFRSANCPARPNRAYCFFSLTTGRCIASDGTDVTNGNPEGYIGGTLTVSDQDGQRIIGWVNAAINALAAIAGIAITAGLIVGGIQYSTSGGNPQAASAAKKRIGQAVLAIIIFVFLYSFLQWLVPGGVFN